LPGKQLPVLPGPALLPNVHAMRLHHRLFRTVSVI
jgi:hypothetical protein